MKFFKKYWLQTILVTLMATSFYIAKYVVTGWSALGYIILAVLFAIMLLMSLGILAIEKVFGIKLKWYHYVVLIPILFQLSKWIMQNVG